MGYMRKENEMSALVVSHWYKLLADTREDTTMTESLEDIITNLKAIFSIYEDAKESLSEIINDPKTRREVIPELKQLLSKVELAQEKHVLHVDPAVEELELEIDTWKSEHIDLKQFIMDDYNNRIVPKFNRSDHEPDWGTFMGSKI